MRVSSADPSACALHHATISVPRHYTLVYLRELCSSVQEFYPVRPNPDAVTHPQRRGRGLLDGGECTIVVTNLDPPDERLAPLGELIAGECAGARSHDSGHSLSPAGTVVGQAAVHARAGLTAPSGRDQDFCGYRPDRSVRL
jgi:hypothetical protein